MKKIIFSLCLCCALLLGSCFAAEEDILSRQSQMLGLEELEREAEEYLGEVDVTSGVDLDKELEKLLELGREAFPGVLRKAVRSGGLILAIVLFCALAEGMLEGTSGKELPTVTLAGSLAVTTVAVSDISSLIGMGAQAIGRMERLSKVLLPSMAVASAAAGTPTAASVRQLGTMLFSDVLLTLINRLLIPLVYVYIAACAANAALGNGGVKRMAEFIKWLITSILTALLLIFTGYLTISGVIAGTTDATAIKMAKFAVSGMVPVVGGILSDAAETVLAGAGILKNSVGVIGMLVILVICLVPFLQLGIHYLTYKLTAAMAATVSENRVSNLVSLISGAFGLVLGMVGACAMLLFISVISGISVVVK